MPSNLREQPEAQEMRANLFIQRVISLFSQTLTVASSCSRVFNNVVDSNYLLSACSLLSLKIYSINTFSIFFLQ